MRVDKVPLASHRLRRIPPGFGWVDHRFLRDGHIRNCSSDAVALYLVLVTVADREGLSYYGDALLQATLGWSRGRLESSRENLVRADLLAWSDPLYQILELPEDERERS